MDCNDETPVVIKTIKWMLWRKFLNLIILKCSCTQRNLHLEYGLSDTFLHFGDETCYASQDVKMLHFSKQNDNVCSHLVVSVSYPKEWLFWLGLILLLIALETVFLPSLAKLGVVNQRKRLFKAIRENSPRVI